MMSCRVRSLGVLGGRILKRNLKQKIEKKDLEKRERKRGRGKRLLSFGDFVFFCSSGHFVLCFCCSLIYVTHTHTFMFCTVCATVSSIDSCISSFFVVVPVV